MKRFLYISAGILLLAISGWVISNIDGTYQLHLEGTRAFLLNTSMGEVWFWTGSRWEKIPGGP